MATNLPSETRFAVDITNRPRRFFDSVGNALGYAQREVYIHPNDRDSARAAILDGRSFSWTYGFNEVTVYPPGKLVEHLFPPSQKHTPGPWVARNVGGRDIVQSDAWRDGTESSRHASDGHEVRVYSRQGAADAALIAAAPELLEALREVLQISDRKHEAWDRAHAAIAKAEGRA